MDGDKDWVDWVCVVGMSAPLCALRVLCCWRLVFPQPENR